MGTALAIACLIAAIINILCIAANVKQNKRLRAERKHLQENPPMLKCNVCGLTLLDDSKESRDIHVLCVLGAKEAIEAREHTQMLETAWSMNRNFDFDREAEQNEAKRKAEDARKALEAPKKPVYKIEINPVVRQTLGVYDDTTDWYRDSASGYYTKYDWVVWKDENILANGSKRYESQAKEAAKAIVAVHKKASKKTVLVD